MGVTINSPLTLTSGLTINSYYARLQGNIVTVKRRSLPGMESTHGVRYFMEASFEIYVSKEAYESHKGMLDRKRVGITRETPFTENLYELAYEEIKRGNECIDD